MTNSPLTDHHRDHQATDPRHQTALRFLYDRINYEQMVRGTSRYPFRLQRIAELLRRLELGGYLHSESSRPKVPLVHIAGTKGKGSTAAMVAAMLSAGGLKTGLYTSPHLHRLEERFRVDGAPCRDDELVDLVERIKPVAESLEDELGPASFFELTTTIALLHFDTSACDAIVLEVGLGGRLDSTNVCAPSICAVSSVGLDHQHVLGETLEEIAGEKAGILKCDAPVVSGVLDESARQVIANKAAEVGAPLVQLGREFDFQYEPSPNWGSQVRYCNRVSPEFDCTASLAMEGRHQARNAAIAIALIDGLRAQGVDVPDAAVQAGLGGLQCAGRVERFDLPDGVIGIVDAAHNVDSIAALCDCLSRRCSQRKITVVFGTSIDKSAETMLAMLFDVADQFVLTRFHGNPRFLRPEDLKPVMTWSMPVGTTIVDDPTGACELALRTTGPGGAVVVCGSFFLAAETRDWFASMTVDRHATD